VTIYLNNAGASLVSDETFDAYLGHLQLEREVGAYKAATFAEPFRERFRESAATLVNAKSTEIAFADSASRAWNAVVYGSGLQRGDRVVTLSSEFGSNLVSLFHYAGGVGAEVVVVGCSLNGTFDMGEFRSEVHDPRTKLVAISHVAAHGSIVNPVETIGKIVKECEGVNYVVDGCQAVGQVSVDVRKIGCDAYTGTGRKWLRGPRGSAFLYVREGSAFRTREVDLASADLAFGSDGRVTGVDVRQDARQFELWERNVAGEIALGVAISASLAVTLDLRERIALSANRLRRAVSENSHLTLIGEENSTSGVVGFVASDPSREDEFERAFALADIAISTMHDWDCPLHFPRTGVSRIFRLAPHYYTSDSEVDRAIAVLDQL